MKESQGSFAWSIADSVRAFSPALRRPIEIRAKAHDANERDHRGDHQWDRRPIQYFHVRVLLNIAGYAGVRFLGIGNGAQKATKPRARISAIWPQVVLPLCHFSRPSLAGTYRLQEKRWLCPRSKADRWSAAKLVVIGLIVLRV